MPAMIGTPTATCAVAPANDMPTGASWLVTDTECGAMIAARDWTSTPLGPIGGWPLSLRTMTGLVLRSRMAMVMLWGEAGTMLYNDAYSALAGARHPWLLGQAVREGWPEVADFNDTIMRAGLAGGTLAFKDQALVLDRHGTPETVVMDLDYSPIVDENGAIAGILCIVVETTEGVVAMRRQHAAETALVAERDRVSGVLENMAEGFVLLDRNFIVLDINAEGLRLEKRSRAAIVGHRLADPWHGGNSGEIAQLLNRGMIDRVPGALEHLIVWNDGRDSWLDVRVYPTAEGLAVFYKDVTTRHEAIAAAAEAAERVQLALDAGAIIGTWVWDVPEDRFIADDRFASSFGLDPDLCRAGLPLEHVTQAIHPDDRARVAVAIEEALARGGLYRAHYRVRRNEAPYRWIEANGRVEFGPNGTAARFPGVLIDIDARRAIEAERDRANTLLQTFVEAVPGVVYAKDRDGRMLVANHGTSAVIGKPPAAYLGLTDAEFLDDKAQGLQVMATDRRIMDSGVAEQVEEDVRLPDGSDAVWLSTKAPLRDDAGNVIGLVGSSVDITARIRAERALEEALKTSDVLLHEVNHRVKNSLQIVTSLLMLQVRQAEDPMLRQGLMEARGRIAVIAGMHERLYSTSEHDRVDFGNYIGDLAAETLQSLGGNNRIRFETQIEPGIIIVLNQAVSLALVVTELVTNAIKYAFPDGRDGQIRLALERTGETVVMTIADDGVGLPGGFDLARQGSLGMKIVKALVRQVRGKVSIGETGEGAVFRIEIPVAEIV